MKKKNGVGRPSEGEPINVRIPVDHIVKLDTEAIAKDVSRAAIIRGIVKKHVEK